MNQKSVHLYQAITNNNIDQIEQLIRDGIDINISDEDGMSPLMQAIVWGNIEVIKILLQAGADLNHKDSRELSPLGLAAKLGKIQVVEYLIKAGARVDFSGYESPLFLAIEFNNIQIAQLLIDAGADVNFGIEDNYTILMRAAHNGHIQCVKLLVNAGADISLVNVDGGNAFLIAAEAGEQEVFHYLYTLTSSQQEREYALRRLASGICRKQRREDKFTSSFIKAVNLSNFHAVKAAITNGVNINAFSENGQTALHIAASRGNIEMIQILKQAGASCEIRDEINGWTPLMEAAIRFQAEAVKFLIDLGANVNAKVDKNGSTALILAVSFYSLINFPSWFKKKVQPLQTIEILIEEGTNVDIEDKFGNTALMIATTKDLIDIVEILIKAGAS